MASRIQKKNRTKKSPRKIAGAVLSLPALKYGDSRTFFIETKFRTSFERFEAWIAEKIEYFLFSPKTKKILNLFKIFFYLN